MRKRLGKYAWRDDFPSVGRGFFARQRFGAATTLGSDKAILPGGQPRRGCDPVAGVKPACQFFPLQMLVYFVTPMAQTANRTHILSQIIGSHRVCGSIDGFKNSRFLLDVVRRGVLPSDKLSLPRR
jgi:hypothetical protein